MNREAVDEIIDDINDVLIEAEVSFPAGREAGASISLSHEQNEQLRAIITTAIALSTPATGPQGYVEGPQFRALKTCKGCSHFKSEHWREPSGDGETYDSGTSADCLKAGRSISTYYGDEPSPPDWCPVAACPAPQPAADQTRSGSNPCPRQNRNS